MRSRLRASAWRRRERRRRASSSCARCSLRMQRRDDVEVELAVRAARRRSRSPAARCCRPSGPTGSAPGSESSRKRSVVGVLEDEAGLAGQPRARARRSRTTPDRPGCGRELHEADGARRLCRSSKSSSSSRRTSSSNFAGGGAAVHHRDSMSRPVASRPQRVTSATCCVEAPQPLDEDLDQRVEERRGGARRWPRSCARRLSRSEHEQGRRRSRPARWPSAASGRTGSSRRRSRRARRAPAPARPCRSPPWR